jgi:hypothetical protein
MAFSIKNILSARLVLFCIVFSFFVSAISAQVKDTINGVVTDSASNAALAAVTVSSEGATAQTDASGAFSLVVSGTRTIAPFETQKAPSINWDSKNSRFSWSGLMDNGSISIQDARGRVITMCSTAQASGKHEVLLADLPQGMFFATVNLNNQSLVYKIMRLQGESGTISKIIPQSASASKSLLAKELATVKAHVLVFSKTGYNSSTITVAAGTASSFSVKVKMTAGGTIPGNAIDTVSVPASGTGATFKTSLVKGELYLLKAIGTVTAGTDQVDAEFGGFGAGGTAKDTISGVDVGIDIGAQTLRQNKTGREKWAGPYNQNHVYYMLVTGTGIPLTLKLVKSGGAAATGSIIVALVRLSPYPPQLAASPLDSVLVPVIQQIVHSTIKPSKSTMYLLQCSGQGKAGGNNAGMGDADYMDYDSTTGAGAEDIGDCNTDYGVGIDDTICKCNMTPRTYWWGPWRKDRYYYTLYTGTGNPVTIMFFDSGYGDNSTTAKLKVKVYPVP